MTKRPFKYRLFLISLSEIRITKVMILCRIGIVDYFCRTNIRLRQGFGGRSGGWRSWSRHARRGEDPRKICSVKRNDFSGLAHLHDEKGIFNKNIFGVWRSWLAHLHGVQGVVCSSQITPTGFAKIQKTKVYSFVYS